MGRFLLLVFLDTGGADVEVDGKDDRRAGHRMLFGGEQGQLVQWELALAEVASQVQVGLTIDPHISPPYKRGC
jgi:hypothetical protein